MPPVSRSIRVFLSSTFRDFQEERDLLVRRIFPELRLLCRTREVDLVEVDLRWGVTAEQSERGEVLPICLNEIDRCKPYFVGMLGQRYGWVPTDDSKYPLEVQESPHLDWVLGQRGRSYTELEILHGVLNKPEMAGRAYFYFRDPAYAESRRGDFVSADSTETKRLMALKQRIRDSGFPVSENCPSPLDIAERIGRDLWAAIDRDFPLRDVPDALERQRLDQDAYAHSRLLGYVPVPGTTEALDMLLDEGTLQHRVMLGASGSGKSALVAHWLDTLRERKRLPERSFVHYLGGCADSTSLDGLLRRLMETIRRWRVTDLAIPAGVLPMARALPDFLAAWGSAGGGLLVLDALNQLDAEHDRTLWWLPQTLPDGLRLLVSTLPGPSHDALDSRGWLNPAAQVRVAPLGAVERRQVVDAHLRQYVKRLEEDHARRLADHPRSANPLFLKMVLEQLRLRATRRGLPELMDSLLAEPDLPALFQRLLQHLEAEHDGPRPGLVSQSMGLLAVARRGLSESELLELLSSNAEHPATQPLPRALWSPLYLELEGWLVNRSGRLGFFHQHVQRAVIDAYLHDPARRDATHGQLGALALQWDGERFGPSLREYGLCEGIHHLLCAGRTDDAYELLANPAFRHASALARGSLDGLREDMLSLGRSLLATATPDHDRIWRVTAWAMEGLHQLRTDFRRELDDAARSADWHRAAACAGMADSPSARLLQACSALATAAGAAGSSLDHLAEIALRQGVPSAMEDLWGRLRSAAQVKEG